MGGSGQRRQDLRSAFMAWPREDGAKPGFENALVQPEQDSFPAGAMEASGGPTVHAGIVLLVP
jgi:hypothetical protein